MIKIILLFQRKNCFYHYYNKIYFFINYKLYNYHKSSLFVYKKIVFNKRIKTNRPLLRKSMQTAMISSISYVSFASFYPTFSFSLFLQRWLSTSRSLYPNAVLVAFSLGTERANVPTCKILRWHVQNACQYHRGCAGWQLGGLTNLIHFLIPK